MRRREFIKVIAGATIWPLAARAQEQRHPIELTIRTMAAQGATQDTLLRTLQEIMAGRSLHLSIINTPGQDGVKAALDSRKDPADGSFLLMTTAYTLTYYPQYGNAGYTIDDFEPVLGIGHYNLVVIAPASSPDSDLKQILARVRAERRTLRYAGIGEVDRLMMAAITKKAGVVLDFVAAGGGPALVAKVVNGEVDVGFGTGTHRPLLKEGKVKVVAQLHSRDSEPRLLKPLDFGVDADMDNFILISAPHGIPANRKAAIAAALIEATSDPRVQEVITNKLLMTPALLKDADLRAALKRQTRGFEVLRAIN